MARADKQDTTKLTVLGRQVDNPEAELVRMLLALAYMYDQYCGPNFGHHFMGAGEDTIEILEDYRIGNERDGVDGAVVARLERGSDLPSYHSEAKSRQEEAQSGGTKSEVLDTILDNVISGAFSSIRRAEAMIPDYRETLIKAKGEAQAKLEAHIKEETAKIEKAYGGCRKCYGKGYATVMQGKSGWATDGDIGGAEGYFASTPTVRMKYCSCDRGKALAQLNQQGE